MNDFQRSQSNMFDVVLNLCRINYGVLSAYVPFVPLFAQFEGYVSELSGWLIKQSDRPEGITIAKNKRRKALEAAAVRLSDVLVVYARVNGLPELERRSKFTPSQLRNAAEAELTGICYQLHSDAADHIGDLAPYLIDAAWLTAFMALIDALVALTGAPASARAAIHEATTEVNRLLKTTASFLRLYFDPMMTHFATTAPDLYSDYRNSRKLTGRISEKPALRGRVSDTEGNPLKGLKVTIAHTQRKSITTALGNFRFKRIATGSYLLIVKEGRKEVARKEVRVPAGGEVVVVVGKE